MSASTSSSSSDYSSPLPAMPLSPFEKMRLAKAALMEDEEQEAKMKRERRKSRRESSVSVISEVSRRSSNASLDSVSPRGKIAGPSILRKPSPPSSYPSDNSLSCSDSYTSLPPRISRTSRGISMTGGGSFSMPTDFGPPIYPVEDGTVKAVPRRSSKVRFSDEPLGPTSSISQQGSLNRVPSNISPRTSIAPTESGMVIFDSPTQIPPSTTIPLPPVRPVRATLKRGSSIEGLRNDLVRSSQVLNLSLNSRTASALSFSSAYSDPFGLQNSPLTRSSIPEMESEVLVDDFKPLHLPYPKLSAKVSPRRASDRPDPSSTQRRSTQDSDSVSNSSSPYAPLRDMLSRDSLESATSSRQSRPSLALSYAPSSRDSYGSITSTLLSANSSSAIARGDSLDGSSLMSESATNSSSSLAFTLPQGLAYTNLLPSHPSNSLSTGSATMEREESETEKMLKKNREFWRDDLGLSPRSGPSPVCPQTSQLEENPAPGIEQIDAALAEGESPCLIPLSSSSTIRHVPRMEPLIPLVADGLITPLEISNPFDRIVIEPQPIIPTCSNSPPARSMPIDSVDLLPARERASSGSTKRRSEDAPEMEGRKPFTKGHSRTNSTLSISGVLSFPVPPSRQQDVSTLEVIIAEQPTPSFTPEREASEADLIGSALGQAEHMKLEAEEESSRNQDEEVHVNASLGQVQDVPGRKGLEDTEAAAVERDFQSTSMSGVESPITLEKGQPPLVIHEISLDTPQPSSDETLADPLSPFIEVKEAAGIEISSKPEIRSSPRESKSTFMISSDVDDDDAESDLDISSDLIDAARRFRIVSPNSSLFEMTGPRTGMRPKPKRLSSTSSLDLRTGMSFTKNLGWSGSESEEEEFVNSMRAITVKKLSGGGYNAGRVRRPRLHRSSFSLTETVKEKALGGSKCATDLGSAEMLRNRPLGVKKSKAATHGMSLHPVPTSTPMGSRSTSDRLSTLSHASTSSVFSSAESNGPQTPCPTDVLPIQTLISALHSKPTILLRNSVSSESSTVGTVPGDFPWGGSAPSSPTGSIRSFKSSGSRSPKKAKPEGTDHQTLLRSPPCHKLPNPTRVINGWGDPEVLIEDDWSCGVASSTSSSGINTLSGSASHSSSSCDHSKPPSRTGDEDKRTDDKVAGTRKMELEGLMKRLSGLESQFNNLLNEEMDMDLCGEM